MGQMLHKESHSMSLSVVLFEEAKNATVYPHFTRVQLQLVHLELADVSLTIETFLILIKVSNKGPTLSPKTNTIKHRIFHFLTLLLVGFFPPKSFSHQLISYGYEIMFVSVLEWFL